MYDWDEEEEEGEEGSSWLEATGKNVILFLVDGTAPMQAGCLPIRWIFSGSEILFSRVDVNSFKKLNSKTVAGIEKKQKKIFQS